jgi:hypothetical protein
MRALGASEIECGRREGQRFWEVLVLIVSIAMGAGLATMLLASPRQMHSGDVMTVNETIVQKGALGELPPLPGPRCLNQSQTSQPPGPTP